MNAQEPGAAAPDLISLMERLAEPSEPPAVSMWPQTQGWLWLGLIVLVVLTWVAWRSIRRWRANAYRREALAALKRCGDDPALIAPILRRTALAAWPRREVAGLTGTAWLRFLDQTGGKGRFASKSGGDLVRAPYAPDNERETNANLRSLAAEWIRHHHAPPTGKDR
ncbi:DUF4381 domain-containing protein [Marinobacter nanhaiticus D15-8W]|uniref:DUF4381 domain-containing protein n=1 Tax=Marinobacter nanhaiticus D15-8W TaxID=626887 RepID=N6WYV5_9GAMM|nr:DUF4381 domain-containing protein [Marinobacter nanhaiticus]ENO13973.1 DUF4381 domain-containing protein [Marinobacter nanhaiticus D15-8W]BES71351.1 DUF4381 domain-containing protein [Marinobacter nanhaiticus D15-8W]